MVFCCASLRGRRNIGQTPFGCNRVIQRGFVSWKGCMDSARLRVIMWLIIGLTLAAVPLHAADESEPADLKFQNRTIATLRATIGSLSPADRVAGAEKRLRDTPPTDFRKPVAVIPYEDSRAIVLGERMIFGIAPEDVDASAGETVDSVADAAAQNLRLALASWLNQRRPEIVLRGVTRVLIATALALVLAFVLRWVRRILLRQLPSRAERHLQKRHVTFFGQDIRGTTVRALRIVIDAGTAVAALVLAYSWLAFSLRQFPLTAPWGEGLRGFFLDTLCMIGIGIVRGIPEMLVVVIILLVTRFVVRLLSTLFDAVERGQVKIRGVHPDTADATRRIVTAVVWVFGIAMAY